MTITDDVQAAIGLVPASAWTPAYDGDGRVRDEPGSPTLPASSSNQEGETPGPVEPRPPGATAGQPGTLPR